ncbi:hypothetical protein J7E93_31175 [Streptomyces sp. ISL-36]|uniref:hypothetical protein n=1 Tax=Streptomyces sp. ISL-36 TaxID=2819182 RepID=UPI001BE9ABC2|nr:hypothetical protein [Streptomyces sp. ISL-36]MBT2444481.1 hypothetical protein [Streptomyces sp. ISL-36]
MPEPGSKKFDKRRAELRKDAEDRGIPDRHADDDAKERLADDPKWRPTGPRTERGRGPKGEREGGDRDR